MENTAPIFGFDVVAGKNKITGCFHDFSSTGFASHPLIEWFGHEVSQLEWRKTRELPEWAQRIFSPHIIAAGNVSNGDELEQIITMSTRNLDHYINTVGETDGDCTDNTKGQNYYCENQKLNPHTPRVMTTLGLSEEQIRFFIEKCMFPEVD
jgi:phycocyanobilin:ferredoxin oxidoreductase